MAKLESVSFQFVKDVPTAPSLLPKNHNQVSTMNTKVFLAALFAAMATIANAQEPKLCQPGCGGQNSGQNAYISSCCQQYEADIGANFDACCGSSCDISIPYRWVDLGSSSDLA